MRVLFRVPVADRIGRAKTHHLQKSPHGIVDQRARLRGHDFSNLTVAFQAVLGAFADDDSRRSVSKIATLRERWVRKLPTQCNGRDDHELVDETQIPHNKCVGQTEGPPIDFAQNTRPTPSSACAPSFGRSGIATSA